MNMHRLVTLATVYNRKETTLRCLRSLIHSCKVSRIEAIHFIVDDNSSDGTSEAIKKYFPFVNVIHGNGELYWAGGMRFGFNEIKDKFRYSFLVAYNDDCIFKPNSIIDLVSGFDQSSGRVGVVVGSLLNPNNIFRRKVFVGGHGCFLHHLHRNLVDSYIEVDSFNMNLCCIKSELISRIGFLDKNYPHSVADFDFGLRVKKSGFKTLLAPSAQGYCSDNSTQGTSREKGLGFLQRIERIFSVKEYPLTPMIHY